MIERVARAAAAARFGTTVDQLYWNQESDAWRQAHIDIARATIAAMREPVADMFQAIPAGAHPEMHETVLENWRAMIDAALK
jgi:hypothetical protein